MVCAHRLIVISINAFESIANIGHICAGALLFQEHQVHNQQAAHSHLAILVCSSRSCSMKKNLKWSRIKSLHASWDSCYILHHSTTLLNDVGWFWFWTAKHLEAHLRPMTIMFWQHPVGVLGDHPPSDWGSCRYREPMSPVPQLWLICTIPALAALSKEYEMRFIGFLYCFCESIVTYRDKFFTKTKAS